MFSSDRPLTTNRLPSSLEIQIMIPVSINLGFGVVLEWQPGLTVGTISKLTRNQSREVYRRYSLGKFAFEPYDLIPGKITTSLKIEKVVLYSEYMITGVKGDVAKLLGMEGKSVYLSDGDLLGALGYVSGSLFFQQFPFAIQEIVHPPEGLSGAQATITTYYDCWLTSNPIEYDIFASDQIIIQECDVVCGRVATSIPVEKAIAPLIRRLLPTSVKIGKF